MTRKKRVGANDGTPSDDEMHSARIMSNGALGAVVTAAYSPNVNGGGSSVQALVNVLAERARDIAAGDLRDLEFMLLAQAQAMNAMFTHLAVLARKQEGRESLQALTTLALRAAAGSRQAIEAIGELRQPRQVTFARQANIASGPQQINNMAPAAGQQPARVAEAAAAPFELSGAPHELLQDAGTSGAIGGRTGYQAPRLAYLESKRRGSLVFRRQET